MPTLGTRRALIAMASVTAGVAAAAVAPSSAYAAADPAPDSLEAAKAAFVAANSGDVTTADLPTCRSFRDIHIGGTFYHVPTTDGGNANCQLQHGDFNLAGVKVLQDALNRCNGESLATDGDYGDLTTGAVKRAQEREGLTKTGVYTLTLFDRMPWPVFDSSTGFLVACVR
jgi:hypothetical protein